MGCVFCQIAAGEIDSDIIYQDDRVVAFRDLNPQAPLHVLIIPREHLTNIDAVAPAEAELLGHCMLIAAELARNEGMAESGYRLVANVGPHGGQSVDHLHFHLLGGRPMQWPPG
jgi:histidine triad (HIT) family protein